MSTIKKYLSLIKFSHSIFAMPFALIGFFIAIAKTSHQVNLNDTIGWRSDVTNFTYWRPLVIKFLLVIFCMVFARSAAKFLSSQRLKAMAALLAKTIQKITRRNFIASGLQ